MPVSLELGGKSPSIVYPDADQDWSVDGIIAAMRFTRQSQSCTAGSRLFLHEDIFDPFLVKVHRRHPHGVLPVLASTLVKGSVGQCVWNSREEGRSPSLDWANVGYSNCPISPKA